LEPGDVSGISLPVNATCGTGGVSSGTIIQSAVNDPVGNRHSSLGLPSCTYNASNELNSPAPSSMGNSSSLQLGTVVSRVFTLLLDKHTLKLWLHACFHF